MTFLDLARDLARLRKEWAAYYLWVRKMQQSNVGDAKAAADEKYIAELTMAEARYEIAKNLLPIIERWNLEDMLRDDPSPNPDTQPSSPDATEEGGSKDCAD